MVLNGDTFSTKASSMQVANTPKRAIDSSGYRFAMYIYIYICIEQSVSNYKLESRKSNLMILWSLGNPVVLWS